MVDDVGMEAAGGTMGGSTRRVPIGLIAAGLVATLVVGLGFLVLRPSSPGYAPGSSHAAVLGADPGCPNIPYQTVKLGNRTWTAESVPDSLRWGPPVHGEIVILRPYVVAAAVSNGNVPTNWGDPPQARFDYDGGSIDLAGGPPPPGCAAVG